ncbi:class I SAM-dependent methyltransferase [Saprospiraceae bacterium]|nr:class I SAM-dependent methyltransferase [Saprospiraceae bacterium]
MDKEFDFKELDEEGLENLEAITEADKFNEWMYDTISSHCTGKILEVGSGIGNISQFFIRDNADITLTDIRDNYLEALSDRFPTTLQEKIDLVHPDFEDLYAGHLGQYDSIFALNVVEHIKDDKTAMSNIKKLLKKKGKVVILVPAFQTLYNVLDKELYHYRRYTSKSLNNIFQVNDIKILKTHFFNAMGIPAWFIAGKLQGEKTIKKSKMRFYNMMVPVFKVFDFPMKKIAGLSVICIGEK